MRKRIFKREAHILGRMVYKLHPDLAQSLMDTYNKPAPALDDYQYIPALFEKFCEDQQLRTEEVKGYLNRPSSVDKRKLFVSLVIRLYFLNIHQSNVTLTIRNCVTEEKIYEEYKKKVDELVERIHPITPSNDD